MFHFLPFRSKRGNSMHMPPISLSWVDFFADFKAFEPFNRSINLFNLYYETVVLCCNRIGYYWCCRIKLYLKFVNECKSKIFLKNLYSGCEHWYTHTSPKHLDILDVREEHYRKAITWTPTGVTKKFTFNFLIIQILPSELRLVEMNHFTGES